MSKKTFVIEYRKDVNYVGFVDADSWQEAQSRFFEEGFSILEDVRAVDTDVMLIEIEAYDESGHERERSTYEPSLKGK